MKNGTLSPIGMVVAGCWLATGVAWAKPPVEPPRSGPQTGGIPRCAAELAECTINLTQTDGLLQGCEDALAPCQATAGQAFPATGQTTCWDSSGGEIDCEGSGHDGEIQAGATLTYTDNGLTIRDENTGLMWMKQDDNNGDCGNLSGSLDKDCTFTWDEAFTFVTSLNASAFAGYTDWRLPNAKELQSIVNYENQDPAVSEAFNTDCAQACSLATCSCTAAEPYWSSTSFAPVPTAFFVSFNEGVVNGADKGSFARVRAVRGGL